MADAEAQMGGLPVELARAEEWARSACWLTPGELALLRRELAAVVEPDEDRVLLVTPDPSRGVRTLGLAQRPRDPRFFFVG